MLQGKEPDIVRIEGEVYYKGHNACQRRTVRSC